jgi:hypothetical protein
VRYLASKDWCADFDTDWQTTEAYLSKQSIVMKWCVVRVSCMQWIRDRCTGTSTAIAYAINLRCSLWPLYQTSPISVDRFLLSSLYTSLYGSKPSQVQFSVSPSCTTVLWFKLATVTLGLSTCALRAKTTSFSLLGKPKSRATRSTTAQWPGKRTQTNASSVTRRCM